MKTKKTFLFFCRDTYDVIVKQSSVGYGLWVGDGIDVVVAKSIKDGLKTIERTDKMFGIDDDVAYYRYSNLPTSQYEFDSFLEMRQAGELIKYR